MANELILSSDSVTARTDKYGSSKFSLAAGKYLKVETGADGDEILNATVPSGKTWSVSVTVAIQET